MVLSQLSTLRNAKPLLMISLINVRGITKFWNLFQECEEIDLENVSWDRFSQVNTVIRKTIIDEDTNSSKEKYNF